MKRTLVLVVVSLVALPIFARSHRVLNAVTVTEADAQPVTDPTLYGRVLRQATEQMARRRDVHASALGDVRSARFFVIPAAGSAAGGGGALFFRSDVTLMNYDIVDEQVLVVYWPLGTSNPPTSSSLISALITLPRNTAVTYVDFVASVMHSGGIGTLLFFPIFGGQLDQHSSIDGMSRIYTRQPGSTGTVSQEFPPVDADNLSAIDTAASMGLRQDAGFRTNWGFVNLDSKPHAVHFRFFGERANSDVTVTVPAYGMLQQAMPGGDYGALVVHFEITDSGTSFVTWVGYASSTDNLTGDGWVAVASADLDPDDLDDIGLLR